MSLIAAMARIIALCALAWLVGSLYGQPLVAVVLMLFAIIVFWMHQMNRVRQWLQHPDTSPPDAFGVWGELLSKVYLLQRGHHKVQKELRDNVTYLEDSFASMRDGVVMVDELGAIKWFNRAAGPLLGLRYPDDIGQHLTNLVRSPEFTQYFLENNYVRPLQYESGQAQGLHLRLEVTHFGASERLLFVRDVSESVRLETMRTDFVANVSHELRTPLTVISGYLETFLANIDEFPERYAKALKQMSQQAVRMEDLLRDLLWLSRIENEEREEKHEQIDMCGLLQELREELVNAFPDNPIQLKLETKVRIPGDYRELHSAISNLLVNAIKYSTAGDPVTVHWYSTKNECIVKVEDRGVGIDPAHIPRLTERFYRVDESRSSASGGTGLGLAIVKHVVAAHGGELHIDSVPNIGSSFSLVFPNGGSRDT